MKATILFADNERGIRQYCRQELEADGFRIVLAEDGEEAVNPLVPESRALGTSSLGHEPSWTSFRNTNIASGN